MILDSYADDRDAAEYNLAAYFLIATEHDGFRTDYRATPKDWWGAYDADLGDPKGGRYWWNGLLRRDFTRGFVVVNPPGNGGRTLAAAADAKAPDGDARSAISLPGAGGRVVLTAPSAIKRQRAGGGGKAKRPHAKRRKLLLRSIPNPRLRRAGAARGRSVGHGLRLRRAALVQGRVRGARRGRVAVSLQRKLSERPLADRPLRPAATAPGSLRAPLRRSAQGHLPRARPASVGPRQTRAARGAPLPRAPLSINLAPCRAACSSSSPLTGAWPCTWRRSRRRCPTHGWSVLVAGPAEAIVYPELERAGVELVRLPIGRALRPRPYGRALRRLARLAEGVDLVHGHSSKAGAIARAAALRAHTPCVYTPHCYGFVGPVGAKRKLAATAIEGALGRVTAATICVADEERRLAARYRVTPRERLHVVHNGCPSCDAAATPLPALAALAAEGPLAACVTVLREQKGVDVFLDAAPLVLERRPDARLAVVGNGDLRGPLEAQAAALGLGPRLRFVDFEPPAARALASLDVFVLPSRWEAFPISVLEALACGVPQVATDGRRHGRGGRRGRHRPALPAGGPGGAGRPDRGAARGRRAARADGRRLARASRRAVHARTHDGGHRRRLPKARSRADSRARVAPSP